MLTGRLLFIERRKRISAIADWLEESNENRWVEQRIQAAVAWLPDADANEAATEAADIAAEIGLSRDAVDAVMDRMRDAGSSYPENVIGWVSRLFDVLIPHAQSVLAIVRLDDAKPYFGPPPTNPADRPGWSRGAFRTLTKQDAS